MTDTFARPQTKLAAALLAASVVSAASIVGLPENHDVPTIDVNVANASVVTDWLWNFGYAVNGVADGVALVPGVASELPFDVATAIGAAAQDPSLSPNVLSWLVQQYVNPSSASGQYTYARIFKERSIDQLAGLLPYPLGLNIIKSVNQIADAINGALSGLPDAGPGRTATTAFLNSDIGQVIYAASLAATAPENVLYETATYLGELPANLEGSVESAIQDPSKIPGLVSGLVYGLVSSPYGLLGSDLSVVSAPFTHIPGPIGELAKNIVNAISNGIDGVLSMLPKPIYTERSEAIQASVPSAATSVAANSLPQASLAVAGGVTLKSIDPVEKKSDTTDSTSRSSQNPGSLSTSSTTPKDSGPAIGDVKPVSAPAAGTDAPKSGASMDAPKSGTGTTVSSPVTSGNKVTPGGTFDNGAKAGTAKESGSGVSGAVTSVASGAGGAGAPGAPGAATSVASGAGGAGTAGAPGAGASHAAAA